MKTVLEVLNFSTEFLNQKNIVNPRRQAEELIGEVLKIGRMGVYLNFDRPVTESELDLCHKWLQRRSLGEPIQYIIGMTHFFNCDITLSPDVLIPRQETEILVEKITKELAKGELSSKKLWDVCSGSGCIGIALKKHFPTLLVTLSDLSKKALEIALENAENNGVEVSCFQGNLFEPFSQQKADFIVCNPPYIAEHEWLNLDVEVRDFEPKNALIGGNTGLEFYEKLANQLPFMLNPGGKVWLEIGAGQGNAIQELFQATVWRSKRVEKDWANHDRFFFLELE